MLQQKKFKNLEIGDTFYWLPEHQLVPKPVMSDVKIAEDRYRGATDNIEGRVDPDRIVWVGTLSK